MKCPIDQTNLAMSDRHGIEIDYCPQCRGVWLDRGELDKIIERSSIGAGAPATSNDMRYSYPKTDSHHPRSDYSENYQKEHKKRKRESFLEDLFDF